MAKREKSAAAEPAQGTPSVATKLISEAMLKKLLKRDAAIKDDIDGKVGELRETIANAVEKHHLHKGAFALLKKFDRMEPEKAAELWDTMLAYMDMAGVMAKIESVAKLPLEGDSDDEAEEGETEMPSGAVVERPQFGGRRQAATAD